MNATDICRAMARTLYVAWMADAHDDQDDSFDAEDQAAGPGQDWMDTVEDPPTNTTAWEEALITAGRVYQDYTLAWGIEPFYVLYDLPDRAERWAHGAMMASMGHGVCWTDDGPIEAPRDTKRFKKGQELPVPDGIAEHVENPFRGEPVEEDR